MGERGMDVSERLLVAGKHLGKCLAGYRDDDLRSSARAAVDLGQIMLDAADEIERMRAAIEDAVETLEAMDLHTDNPLYDRLRAVVEQSPPVTGKE